MWVAVDEKGNGCSDEKPGRNRMLNGMGKRGSKGFAELGE